MLKPTEEPKYTYRDLVDCARLTAIAVITELNLIKYEITHNAALKKYGRARFEKWVNAGRLIPSNINGRFRKYRFLDCEAIAAEESRYFSKTQTINRTN